MLTNLGRTRCQIKKQTNKHSDELVKVVEYDTFLKNMASVCTSINQI